MKKVKSKSELLDESIVAYFEKRCDSILECLKDSPGAKYIRDIINKEKEEGRDNG